MKETPLFLNARMCPQGAKTDRRTAMTMDNHAACYAAFQSKDSRFDGHFFVGVTSTGIYCRPVCRARLPRPENCTFFKTAAEAERAGFRPCLLCRPELAPGCAPMVTQRCPADRDQPRSGGPGDPAPDTQRCPGDCPRLRAGGRLPQAGSPGGEAFGGILREH